jgi:Pyruvate/2-oxoacid:ferredoxin oxidoreductase gamma subunit
MKREIRITGFGGQGVILSGVIVGKAASIYAEKNATMTQDLVNPGEVKKGLKRYPIQAQRIAETDLGRKIVTNIVILGYFTAVTEAVPKEAMIEAIKSSVPKGTIDLNLQAFERGYDAFAEG